MNVRVVEVKSYYPKRPNMNIQIYISTTTETNLQDIRKKYHVSLSTIAQVITDYFRPNIKKYNNEFLTTYIDKDHRNRTTIKPKNADYENEFFKQLNCSPSIASHVYSNMLYYFAKKDFKYLYGTNDEKQIDKYNKDLWKEFDKKKEIFWNYNATLRQQVRVIRKNKEYFQKILGAM